MFGYRQSVHRSVSDKFSVGLSGQLTQVLWNTCVVNQRKQNSLCSLFSDANKSLKSSVLPNLFSVSMLRMGQVVAVGPWKGAAPLVVSYCRIFHRDASPSCTGRIAIMIYLPNPCLAILQYRVNNRSKLLNLSHFGGLSGLFNITFQNIYSYVRISKHSMYIM